VVFFAVPAEEYGDIEWRVAQARAGKRSSWGASRALRLGHSTTSTLDDDSPHVGGPRTARPACPRQQCCIVKTIRYVGRASHAGGAADMGINALYAAPGRAHPVNAIRETFRTRNDPVHPIITHGGSQVNVIPGEVRLEDLRRGRTVDAILDAQKKVDRAFKGGRPRAGAKVEIETLPATCDGLRQTMARHHEPRRRRFVGAEHFVHRAPYGLDRHGRSQHGVPILHPYVGGATGSGHGADYKIVDPQLAYVTNAKALPRWRGHAGRGAAGAREVLKAAKPP